MIPIMLLYLLPTNNVTIFSTIFDNLDASVPPWIGYNEEEELKAQILEISAVSYGTIIVDHTPH